MYNKSLDTASIDSMKEALAKVSLEEADRAKHYKGATPPEDMKNNRKGKGAQDMMQPADNAIANPAADEVQVVNKDFADMTKNVKVAKKRSTDKDTGDKKVVPSGTPMKDPAGPVKTAESVEKTKPQWIIDAYDEMHEAMSAADHRASRTRAGLPARPTAYRPKDIEKMAKDPKYKGNTSGLERAIRKYAGKRFDNNAFIQKVIRKHAETNEAIKYTHAVVDGTGKVAGMTSLGKERDAKDIARRHKGKVIKLKKPMSSKKGDMMINRPFKEAKMDPVGKADADIDNDGDVDSSDKYLHNRRKAIKKAIKK